MSKDEVKALLIFNEWFERLNLPVVNWAVMRRAFVKGYLSAIPQKELGTNMAKKIVKKAAKKVVKKAIKK